MFFLSIGAAPTPAPPRAVPEGAWGGRGIALTVEESGAKLELDCAHGAIPVRLVLDADGRFEVSGTFTRERPGPVRMGPSGEAEEGKGEPVVYSGTLEEGVLRVTIRIGKDGRDIGPLEARLGRAPLLHKCL